MRTRFRFSWGCSQAVVQNCNSRHFGCVLLFAPSNTILDLNGLTIEPLPVVLNGPSVTVSNSPHELWPHACRIRDRRDAQ